jgi:uncharacterized membrane protein (DUF485 family)
MAERYQKGGRLSKRSFASDDALAPCHAAGYADCGRSRMNRSERIRQHPAYARLVRRRRRLAWSLTALMGSAYFGYIALIAFNKSLLATPVAGGATTIGIPVGFGLILLGIALTAYYVRIANRDHDALLAELLADVPE